MCALFSFITYTSMILVLRQNIPNIHLIDTKAPTVLKRCKVLTLLSSISRGPVNTRKGLIIFLTQWLCALRKILKYSLTGFTTFCDFSFIILAVVKEFALISQSVNEVSNSRTLNLLTIVLLLTAIAQKQNTHFQIYSFCTDTSCWIVIGCIMQEGHILLRCTRPCQANVKRI